MNQAAGEYPNMPTGTDTEYVAAADRDGNLVSFIQSNFMGFGSGVVEPETGIILQNRGHLFSLDENHPNCIGPHKRCVHTLMPGNDFQRRQAVCGARIEGRPCPAASAGADDYESDRLRYDAAAGDRRAALQSYRSDKSWLGAGNSTSGQGRAWRAAAIKSSVAIRRVLAART